MPQSTVELRQLASPFELETLLARSARTLKLIGDRQDVRDAVQALAEPSEAPRPIVLHRREALPLGKR